MSHEIKEAVLAALEDRKVIETLASSIQKEIIKQKSNPTNIEDDLVKNHVIFGQADSETAVFMTAKDVSDKITEFNKHAEIRPRILGKALMVDAVITKQSNAGRVYFIENVVEEITADLLDAFLPKKVADIIADEDKTPAEADAIATSGTDKADLTQEDINAMDLSALLLLNENTAAIKAKKANKMDADELRAKLIEKLDIKPAPIAEKPEKKKKEESTAKPAQEVKEGLPVDMGLLIKAVNGFEDLEDYKEHLESFSRSKLIKHINEHKMPLHTENRTEDEIVDAICGLIAKNLEFEEEEPVAKQEPKKEEEQGESLKEKKDKKKDKNKKKKNK